MSPDMVSRMPAADTDADPALWDLPFIAAVAARRARSADVGNDLWYQALESDLAQTLAP